MIKIYILRVALVVAMLFCNALFASELKIESSAYLPVRAAFETNTSKFLIRFNLEKLSENVDIDLAYIRLKADIDTTVTTKLNLIVYPVTEFWTASETPSVKTEIAYADTLPILGITKGKGSQDIELIVTELVQAWTSGSLDNNGIIIMGLENSESALDIYTEKPGVKAELTVLYSMSETKQD